MKTANEALIEYIVSLTNAQADKLLEKLSSIANGDILSAALVDKLTGKEAV